MTTSVQDTIVDQLTKSGFYIDTTSESEDGETTVFMSKRVNNHSTRYVEVDQDGNCNGMLPHPFFAQLPNFLK